MFKGNKYGTTKTAFYRDKNFHYEERNGNLILYLITSLSLALLMPQEWMQESINYKTPLNLYSTYFCYLKGTTDYGLLYK